MGAYKRRWQIDKNNCFLWYMTRHVVYSIVGQGRGMAWESEKPILNRYMLVGEIRSADAMTWSITEWIDTTQDSVIFGNNSALHDSLVSLGECHLIIVCADRLFLWLIGSINKWDTQQDLMSGSWYYYFGTRGYRCIKSTSLGKEAHINLYYYYWP